MRQIGNIATRNRKRHSCRAKVMRWFFSITVAFVLVFGSLGYAFAERLAHTEKADVLVSFTEKPGMVEQALIQNAGGMVSLQSAPAGEGAPPPVAPEPGSRDVSHIVDNQGTFTQSVTIKSEDGKVQLNIAKGTTLKLPRGKTEEANSQSNR